MTRSFKDHFSKQAEAYARYRPTYPAELFAYLSDLVPEGKTAWDCATGNGQVAQGLLPYFHTIYATDASAQQLAQATAIDRIHYQVAAAEQSGLDAGSIDLITVAQALHWFDLEQFYAEVRRVASPNAVLACWCYGRFEAPAAPAAIRQALQDFYQEVDPFWPPERDLVKDNYQSIPFPFAELPPPTFKMTIDWTADHLIGYLNTWSATQRWIAAVGLEPLSAVTNHLLNVWGEPSSTQRIEWPLYFRIGRVGNSSIA